MGASFEDVIVIDNDGHIVPDQTQPLTLESDEVRVQRIEAWVFRAGGRGACVARDPVGGVAGWKLNPGPDGYFGDKLTPGEATGMGLSVSEMQDGGLMVRHWVKPLTLKYAEATNSV
jgi:hypothetical protein